MGNWTQKCTWYNFPPDVSSHGNAIEQKNSYLPKGYDILKKQTKRDFLKLVFFSTIIQQLTLLSSKALLL